MEAKTVRSVPPAAAASEQVEGCVRPRRRRGIDRPSEMHPSQPTASLSIKKSKTAAKPAPAPAGLAKTRPKRKRAIVERPGMVRSDDPSLSFAQPKGGCSKLGGFVGVDGYRRPVLCCADHVVGTSEFEEKGLCRPLFVMCLHQAMDYCWKSTIRLRVPRNVLCDSAPLHRARRDYAL